MTFLIDLNYIIMNPLHCDLDKTKSNFRLYEVQKIFGMLKKKFLDVEFTIFIKIN